MVAAATVTVRHVVLEGGKDTFVFVFLVRRRITERKIQRGEGVLCSVFPGVSCTVCVRSGLREEDEKIRTVGVVLARCLVYKGYKYIGKELCL
jgi:hypothetical protein